MRIEISNKSGTSTDAEFSIKLVKQASPEGVEQKQTEDSASIEKPQLPPSFYHVTRIDFPKKVSTENCLRTLESGNTNISTRKESAEQKTAETQQSRTTAVDSVGFSINNLTRRPRGSLKRKVKSEVGLLSGTPQSMFSSQHIKRQDSDLQIPYFIDGINSGSQQLALLRLGNAKAVGMMVVLEFEDLPTQYILAQMPNKKSVFLDEIIKLVKERKAKKISFYLFNKKYYSSDNSSELTYIQKTFKLFFHGNAKILFKEFSAQGNCEIYSLPILNYRHLLFNPQQNRVYCVEDIKIDGLSSLKEQNSSNEKETSFIANEIEEGKIQRIDAKFLEQYEKTHSFVKKCDIEERPSLTASSAASEESEDILEPPSCCPCAIL
jgi:hypothetical protein